MALVSSNQSYFTQAIHRLVITPPSPHLLLKDKPCQPDTLPMIKVPKTINIILPRVNETLIGVKTNKFRDVMCAKYKSVTPGLSIDCVRAAPEQVKVVLPKEKKRAPPSDLENEEKHQWPTIMMMHDNIKTLTDYTHAL
jgi:hypothetical protein